MSNASNAKEVPLPAFVPATPYAFWWGMVPGNFDKCVIVYAHGELHARGLATTKLEGIVGHSGFVLGDRIAVV